MGIGCTINMQTIWKYASSKWLTANQNKKNRNEIEDWRIEMSFEEFPIEREKSLIGFKYILLEMWEGYYYLQCKIKRFSCMFVC